MEQGNMNHLSDQSTACNNSFNWSLLSHEEKAFVVAYVDHAYSIEEASRATGLDKSYCYHLLNLPLINNAINALQEEAAEMEWLNEKWVKSQLVKLYAKVSGEEEVPIITSRGEEIFARKFSPEISMKILEYVAPKRNKPIEVEINVADELQKLVDIAKMVDIGGESAD